MHPMLKPALRRAWRGRKTVQFGVTPAHAVKVGPVDIATGSFLELLDGTRGLPLLREEARALDLSDHQVDTLVRRLANAGLIDDVTGRRPRSRSVTEPGRRPGAAASRPGVTLGHPPRTGRRDAQAGGPPCDAGPGARRRPGRCGDRRGAVRLRGGPGRGAGRRVSPSPGTSRRAGFRQRRSESAGTPQPGSWSVARPSAPLVGRRGRQTPRRVTRQRVAHLRVVGPGCRWSWSPLGTVSRSTPPIPAPPNRGSPRALLISTPG